MPDIAKCYGEGCPLKEKCYRYTSKPSEYRQAYFTPPPFKDGICEEFMLDVHRIRNLSTKSDKIVNLEEK